MAQARQTDETGETTPTAGQPQGFLGNSTTILLIIFAVAVFLWSRRRRAALEERLQQQRREREASAEQSALDVARIMRRPAPEGAAAAAASEGLASAARMPAEPRTAGAVDGQDGDRALVIERAEASAAAERAAEEQAERAARAAELGGESAERRMAAAEAAAEEARADTADAQRARADGATGTGAPERESADALRAAMRELDNEIAVPLGAVAGDGTATCPPGFPIKGNASSRIYHEPGQVSYPPTIAEFCFASAEAAEAAGFRQSRARGQRPPK